MHQWGYDQDLPVQYAKWLGNLVRGDFGWSHSRHRRVAEVLIETVPRTLLLMGTALLAGVVAGLALGTWQAARRGTVAERASNAVTIGALSVPEFLVALAALARCRPRDGTGSR